MAGTPSEPGKGPLAALELAAERLADRELSALAEPDLHAELGTLERVSRRVEARQMRAANELRARQTRRLRAAGADPVRAGQQADRQTRQELTDELQWTPSKARRATATGRNLDAAPGAGRAFDAGRLSPAHAQVLAETLAALDPEWREEAEAELLAWAEQENAVAFGRRCRRLLARWDQEAAQRAEDRRRARRRARVTQTADGMVALSGQWSGLDGECLKTGIEAFRRPDGPGEARDPGKRTADALVAMARAALDAGTAPSVHGARPHVSVTIDHDAVLRQSGVAEAAWTGPLPVTEIRRLLADCGVSRLLVDSDGVPLEAGAQVRTVPAGLARALATRDGGCIAVGCDMPAGWCEVMHLATPYRLQGRLTLDTAGLGCPRHHRLLDRGGWQITWNARRPILHPPGSPPAIRPLETAPGDQEPARAGLADADGMGRKVSAVGSRGRSPAGPQARRGAPRRTRSAPSPRRPSAPGPPVEPPGAVEPPGGASAGEPSRRASEREPPRDSPSRGSRSRAGPGSRSPRRDEPSSGPGRSPAAAQRLWFDDAPP